MQTLVYLFDEVTGEYTAPYFCQPDPLEEGKLIQPVHSTFIKPPAAPKGQTALFGAGAWVLVEDHRGALMYRTSDRQPAVCDTIGPIPDGFSLVAPQPTPEEQATADARTMQEAKDAQDVAAAKAYGKLTSLKAMTPAQVQSWVAANVTNLAQAQDAIATLAIAVSVLARRI